LQILSNNKNAKVLERAKAASVAAFSFNKTALYERDDVLHLVEGANPDLIVLAGFLWLFPKKIIQAFPNKIINIHPALLPQFGGKGMYGKYVHEAVCAFAKAQNEPVSSGITIHYVSAEYDEGAIIFQATVPVEPKETPESLAEKIHKLEYQHFPIIIDKLLKEQ